MWFKQPTAYASTTHLSRPPRPPPAAPGTIDPNKSGKYTSKPTRKRETIGTGTSVGVAIAGVAALWFIVHIVIHAVTAGHQRRTAVTVAILAQCTTAAQLHADAAHDDDVHGADSTAADAGSLAMTGKRFKAPRAAALATAVLAREAAAANTLDLLPPPRSVTLRPLQRTPLVRAAASKKEHAGALALRKKPNNIFWKLKRFIGTELRWQAREFRTLARFLRRCWGGSRDAVGKVFRLVPCTGAAVRDAADDATDPAHVTACALLHPGGAPTAVLFEATFSFGLAGRNAGAAWRQCLRNDAQLEQLEAALAAALRDGDGIKPSDNDSEPPELRQVGAVAVTLLDDEPHACLDKKRAAGMRLSSAPSPGEAPADAAAVRSFGLAAPVAKRLAAVLLLSLRDTAAPVQAQDSAVAQDAAV